jgi:Flp pilus assembly protein TadD
VRYVDRARDGTSAEQIREDLRRAADLNPFSSVPVLGQGRLAIELNRPEEARAAYLRALEREETWIGHLQLALLDAQAGKWQDAEQRLEQASRLSAEDPVIAEARKRVLSRKRVDPAEFDRTVVERPLSAVQNMG